MGAIILKQEENPLNAVLQRFMARADANRSEKEKRRIEAEQFAMTHGLDKERTAAMVAQSGATTKATTAESDAKRVADILAPVFETSKRIDASGPEGIVKNTAYLASVAQKYEKDAGVMAQLGPRLIERPPLPADIAAGNIGQWINDVTTRVRNGGQNLVDVDTMAKLATNKELSSSAAAYQVQSEQGPAAVKQSAAITRGAEAGATAKLEAQTRREIEAMGNAASLKASAASDAARVQVQGMSDAAADARATAADQRAKHKPMSGEAGKTLGVVQSSRSDINLLRDAFQKGYKSAVIGISTGTDRRLHLAAQNLADKIGRVRSGGAVPNQERKAFAGNLSVGMMDFLFGSSAEAIAQLNDIDSEMKITENAITAGTWVPSAKSGGGKDVLVMKNGARVRALPNGQYEELGPDE